MTSFVPLRFYSEYSVDSSIIRLEELIAFAKQEKFPALALTDSMNMFAAIKFYKVCRENGIKPIFGADFAINNPENIHEPFHLVLLAKDYKGYLQLCQLLTRAYVESDDGSAIPGIEWDWLETIERDHLIALSGAQSGVIGYYILQEQWDKALSWAKRLGNWFNGTFYLEIQRFFEVPVQVDETVKLNFQRLRAQAEKSLLGSIKLAQELELPLVATHSAQFLKREDFAAQEVKVCITRGDILADPKRKQLFHPSQYSLTALEMEELFQDLPSALENSFEIAKRCTVSLALGQTCLPNFPIPEGEDLASYLTKVAHKGLENRLFQLFPAEELRQNKIPIYRERLDFELEIIVQMGFAGYFLIVADFINWAKNNNCPVGPGRGSGAGSLVAYSLNITELDPIQYGLLFERFLNPERVSMPDFDIDFCQENRNRVIEYVREKYGTEAVSQIITFGTMSSKAVIRDVGRVLGLPFSFCDKLSKLIPIEANRPVGLKRSMELEPEIPRLLKEESAEELMELALKLENLVRNMGMHAGGVLIAPRKLTDFCPIYKASGTDTVPVSMYDKDDVEAVGLIKFDFLGLRNLTILQMAQELVTQHRGTSINLANISLEDEKAFQIFQEANTTAIFQFESSGMKRMLVEAKPSKFEEIIAFVALYRPGPMDLIPDFIRRMQGEPFEYLHPYVQEILGPTYGIMVYQEQVMQTAQVCAGYTLGQADLLRRAMGKKKLEEMLKQRAVFVEGALHRGLEKEKANEVFDYMERFAGYGFNKSHAAAYALIAYQTAWLKAHYNVEFMSATMSSELNNTDQLEVFYEDAKRNQLRILPPSINQSFYYFVPESTDSLRYALGAIKGVGEYAVDCIVKERKEHGAYRDLFDFCARLGKSVINKRVLESLIRAGAFDELESNRAILFENITLALDYAEQRKTHKVQGGLFDLDQEIKQVVRMKPSPNWKLSRRLQEEKQAVGFYISGHPFEPYQAVLEHLPKRLKLAQLKVGEGFWIGGVINKLRSLITRSGRKLWLMELDDRTQRCEVSLSEEVLEDYAKSLQVDIPIFCQVHIKKIEYHQADELRVVVKKIIDLEEVRSRYAHCLEVQITPGTPLESLLALLNTYRSQDPIVGVPLKIAYQDSCVRGYLKPSVKWKLSPREDLLDALENLIGSSNVHLEWK
ncbi:MAG: DNA polymerase III subunit alpha [Neisseriaceae bacterium]